MLNRKETVNLLEWAHAQNPGPWKAHSLTAARAAETIAKNVGLDPERAWTGGALHDIGRYEGVRGMHHCIAGYRFMMDRNEPEIARICMTHSFVLGDIEEYCGQRDVNEEELETIRGFLQTHEMDDYDRLIQLCDAISLSEGVCLIEKRLLDVALRYGTNAYTVTKWHKTMEICSDFEKRIGASFYSLFDDAIRTTFRL